MCAYLPPFVLADVDFGSTLQSLEFEPAQGNMPHCVNISITPDDVLEFDEMFTLQLSTNEPRAVLLNPNSSTVTIFDDDSKIISSMADNF